MPPAITDAWLAFWSKVRIGDGCWLWRGSRTGNSRYGKVRLGGRRGILTGAHQAAWMLERGPIPQGMHVCHRCDVRLCVRPSHLFLGTATDNMADMVAKGRARNGGISAERRAAASLRWRGTAHFRAKLDDESVVRLRAMRARGDLLREIASALSVSKSTVRAVLARQTWRHVP